jgi:hypothetical protein
MVKKLLYCIAVLTLLALLPINDGQGQEPKKSQEGKTQTSFTLKNLGGKISPKGDALIASFGDPDSEQRVIPVRIDPSLIAAKKPKKKTSQSPDYEKYHTIIHLVGNKPQETVKDEDNIIAYVFSANVGGKDKVTKLQRRIGQVIPILSEKSYDAAGTVGTRITFGGSKEDPLAIVPGVLLWQGAINVDPQFGVFLDQDTQLIPAK